MPAFKLNTAVPTDFRPRLTDRNADLVASVALIRNLAVGVAIVP